MRVLLCFFSAFVLAEDTSLTKIQKTLDQIKTLQTSFVQTVKSKVMGTTEVTKGQILLSKPHSLRWDSESLVQILNEKEMLMIRPKAQRGKTVVDIYPANKQQQSPHLKLLLGTLKLEKSFSAKKVSSTKGSITYKFTPKAKSEQSFSATFETPSYQMTNIFFETDDSQTEVQFTDSKTNSSITADKFEYKPAQADILNRH